MKTKDKISLVFHFKQADINLPHDFHLAGAINEMVKQEEHVTKWFKKEYLIAKRKFNFQFRNWQMKQNQSLEQEDKLLTNAKLSTNLEMSPGQKQPPKAKAFLLEFLFDQATLAFEDDPMKQMFVDQNEIAETLADRGVFMVRPNVLFNMLKKFKKLGVYQ